MFKATRCKNLINNSCSQVQRSTLNYSSTSHQKIPSEICWSFFLKQSDDVVIIKDDFLTRKHRLFITQSSPTDQLPGSVYILS